MIGLYSDEETTRDEALVHLTQLLEIRQETVIAIEAAKDANRWPVKELEMAYNLQERIFQTCNERWPGILGEASALL